MGQRTDQAERDVFRQRELIGQRLGQLNARLERDVDQVGERLREQVSTVREQASEVADRVPGRRALEEQVPRHPLTSVLGGFGVGVALGMMRTPGFAGGSSGDAARDNRASSWRGSAHDRSGDGPGLVGRLAGVALGTVAGTIQQRLTEMAEDAVSGFMGRKENGDRASRTETPS